MFKSIRRVIGYTQAMVLALHAGLAMDIATIKGGYKKPKNTKKVSGGKKSSYKYVWGTLGLSAVSTAIMKDHGAILSRNERKIWARQQVTPFKLYF